MPVSTEFAAALLSFRYASNNDNNCCGATKGSEQQHNQDLKEIY